MLCVSTITQDPLANFHSLAQNSYVQQLAGLTGLTTLPEHAHEVLLSAAFYFAIFFLSSLIAPKFVPQYRQLSPRNQHGFDSHVVSSVNAVVMCGLSFPLFFTPELSSLTSFTPYSGFVVATTLGYFVWDLWVTVVYFKYNGLSYCAHAATAFFTFAQALRPFMMSYAAPFMWYEASTPFVNVNWFAGVVPGWISPTVRQLNGLCTLLTFFFCRILPGPINGYLLFREALSGPVEGVPRYIVVCVLACYAVLSALNFVWFSKMIKILRKTLKQMRAKKE